MVATRRGVRVYSPSKTNPEQSSDVQATPSTGRRTRRTAVQSESPPTKDALLETTHPGSSLRRCTRASRLHSPDQPCTPVGSCHEADTSDLESCCSAVSDAQPPLTRTRGRSTRKPRAASQEDGEISEVDSCSSAVSASQASQSSCTRSTRRKTIIPASSDPTASDQAGDMEVGPVPPEVDSCSSAVSESQRVTRSQRKKPTTRTSRSVAKQPTTTEDSELSDADSCTSIISGMNVSQSAARRSTRSRRRTGPIPLHLDDTSEGSLSPSRVTRAARAKAAADISEPQSCESEGFESGPSYSSITTRRLGKSQSTPGAKAAGSDSDLTDVHSPVGSPRSTRSRGGTPCSSRAGSGNSSRSTRASRHSLRDLSIVLEKALVPATGEEEETASLNDSMLEDTVIGEEDADCTLLEDNDKTQHTPEETESVNCADVTSVGPDAISLEKGVVVISDEDSNVCPLISEEAVIEAAVAVRHQQEEPCAENKHGDTSEMEEMQETVEASEPVEPCQSMTVTLCEGTAETTEEKVEAVELADADFHPLQGNEDAAVETRPCEEEEEEEEKMEVSTLSGDAQLVVDSSELQVEKEEATELADADLHPPQGNEGATMETRPCEEGEEKMEVSTLSGDAHQVVDSSKLQVESIQVTSSQRQTITVESRPEQQSDDVTVENRKIISLLESSEDEDESAEEEEQGKEEREVSEEEDYGAEDRAGPSSKSEAAAAAAASSSSSVDGLFMIDTRPGQQADEDYYKTKAMEKEGDEQEEQDEEFVDEEGDEDENADILFSSRNPHLKEMSSRIDPGIRLKELGGLYINFDGSKSKPVSSSLQKLKEKKIQDEVMKKSVIGPDFEKKDAVPPYSESKEAAKLKRRVEREKSTGDGWFNMKAPEITQELKGDLNILKMRGSMDPKRFYKKNDRDGFPKYFQVGTVVDNPVDFYHSRIAKKDRKRTMVEELLSDAQFRQNNKKKYQQIVTEKAALGAGRRNNNKKKKFHKK